MQIRITRQWVCIRATVSLLTFYFSISDRQDSSSSPWQRFKASVLRPPIGLDSPQVCFFFPRSPSYSLSANLTPTIMPTNNVRGRYGITTTPCTLLLQMFMLDLLECTFSGLCESPCKYLCMQGRWRASRDLWRSYSRRPIWNTFCTCWQRCWLWRPSNHPIILQRVLTLVIVNF